jgi:hypothetical protein
MATTALDIITGAAKLLGVVFKSEALSADEANDGLIVLNDMLASWSNEDLLTYTFLDESFPLVAGTASYTIGSGQTFNTVRPINIVTAYVRVGTIDYPLEIIPSEVYELQIQSKSIQSSIPQFLTYDNSYPAGTIKLYPVPSQVITLTLHSNKPLTSFAALTTTFDLPPGWARAIKYNLALELAPQYGVEIPPSVPPLAKQSMGAIKMATAANLPKPYIGPFSTGKTYILQGGF